MVWGNVFTIKWKKSTDHGFAPWKKRMWEADFIPGSWQLTVVVQKSVVKPQNPKALQHAFRGQVIFPGLSGPHCNSGFILDRRRVKFELWSIGYGEYSRDRWWITRRNTHSKSNLQNRTTCKPNAESTRGCSRRLMIECTTFPFICIYVEAFYLGDRYAELGSNR